MTSKTGISDKAQLATDHYIANVVISPREGYNWHKAMLEAGYAASTVKSNAKETWDIVGVQEQIEGARARILAAGEDCIGFIRSEHLRLAYKAESKNDLVNATRNLEGYGKTYAAYKDVLNTTSTDQPAELTEADLDQARVDAKAVTMSKLAGPKLSDKGPSGTHDPLYQGETA